MSEGLVYDSLGVPLNEGDIIIMKDIAFRCIAIKLPERPQILDPTKRNPPPQIPLIVGIRLIADLTVTCEIGKRLRDVYKSAAVPERVDASQSKNDKKPSVS